MSNQPFKNISLFLYLYSGNSSYLASIKDLLPSFDNIQIFKKKHIHFPSQLDDKNVFVHELKNSDELGVTLNNVLQDIGSDWVLYLIEDEVPQLDNFDPGKLEKNQTYEAVIKLSGNLLPNFLFEIRLFPVQSDITFKGMLYPSVEDSIYRSTYNVNSKSFILHRETPVLDQFKIDDVKHDSSSRSIMDQLLHAFSLLDLNNLEKAKSLLNPLTSYKHISEHNKIAVYNGLAKIYAELKNWDKAQSFIQKSISITEHQRMPYLLQFNRHQLHHQWTDAYKQLYNYLDVLSTGTLANFDVALPLDHTHQLLADMAYRAGFNERAFAHYEEYYNLMKKQEGEVTDDVIDKLFLYSIELGEKENAIKYFNELYGTWLERSISKQEWDTIDSSISLFLENEWYGVAAESYEQLFARNEENKNILRRWVAALIKNGEIEKAQGLIQKHKSVIS